MFLHPPPFSLLLLLACLPPSRPSATPGVCFLNRSHLSFPTSVRVHCHSTGRKQNKWVETQMTILETVVRDDWISLCPKLVGTILFFTGTPITRRTVASVRSLRPI